MKRKTRQKTTTGIHGKENKSKKATGKEKTNGGRQLLAKRITKTKGQQPLLDFGNRLKKGTQEGCRFVLVCFDFTPTNF